MLYTTTSGRMLNYHWSRPMQHGLQSQGIEHLFFQAPDIGAAETSIQTAIDGKRLTGASPDGGYE